jgi:hypothetical protein
MEMHNGKLVILAQTIDLQSHESRLHQPTRSNYAQRALPDTTHTLLIQSHIHGLMNTQTLHRNQISKNISIVYSS